MLPKTIWLIVKNTLSLFVKLHLFLIPGKKFKCLKMNMMLNVDAFMYLPDGLKIKIIYNLRNSQFLHCIFNLLAQRFHFRQRPRQPDITLNSLILHKHKSHEPLTCADCGLLYRRRKWSMRLHVNALGALDRLQHLPECVHCVCVCQCGGQIDR